MSSGDSRTTSSSSRLSQFGIYRSIDARTEEFLRLSRKRQIRQGCVCAAVSTAITVTIVITVLLVYEYTMNLDSNTTLKSRMAAWHGIFNDTSPFEVKYTKSKVNVDPTTLKLLPLVLKALNQNKNVEKPSQNTNLGLVTETSKDVIEQDFKRNLFHGSKQTQSAYTNDFKSSPALGYRNTFNNLDYYRKIRQNNDYNRMLNYFDKMINMNTLDTSAFSSEEIKDESSTKRSTQTSLIIEKNNHTKLFNRTTKPRNGGNKTTKLQKHTTRQPTKLTRQHSKIIPLPATETVLTFGEFLKRKHEKTSHNRNQRLSLIDAPYETATMETTKHCNCSKKLAELLLKLFTDIENILPELQTYKTTCGLDKLSGMTVSANTSVSTKTMRKITKVLKLPVVKQKASSTFGQKLNNTPVNIYNFKEHSILSQTIANNSWLPIFDLDLNSNFTNIQNKAVGFEITTMKASAEPTYTTPLFEGFNTAPISEMKNKTTGRPKAKSDEKEAHTYTTFTTTHTPHIIDDLDNYLYSSISEHPLHKDGDLHTFEESFKGLNFVTKSDEVVLPHNDHAHIFPLLDKTETAKDLQIEQKENTTSIINWFSIMKTKNKEDNIFHPKRPNNQSQYKSETIIEPKEHLTEFNNRSQVEPKIIGNLNVFNEIDSYYYQNASLQRKRIHPIWPEEENKNKYFVTPVLSHSKTSNTSNASILPTFNGTESNLSTFDNNKEIMKRDHPKQQQYTMSINNQQIESKLEIKPIDSNEIFQTTKTNNTLIHSKKNAANLQPSAPQTFFSKFADINDLLYQTKNISNVTIYENFNFGHNADDHNAIAALEYDEFKFLNDEILESEGPEGKRSEIDKYEILKLNKQQNDYFDEPKEFIKSMIPVSRPVFLEIQRSDLKHDQDYGTSENNFE